MIFSRSKGEALDQYRVSGDIGVVENTLESSLATLRLHEPMFTSEVRFTDRVFSFHRKFLNAHFGTNYPSVDFDLLYNMVSGDSGDPLMMSMAAVRWLHPSDDWGIWVDVNEARRFETAVYNFSDTVRDLSGNLLRLDLGDYQSSLSCEEWSLSSPSTNSIRSGLPMSKFPRNRFVGGL